MRIAIDGRVVADRFPGVGRYTYELVAALADVATGDELVLLRDVGARNTRFDLDGLGRRANVRLVETTLPPLGLRGRLELGRRMRRLVPQVAHFPSFDVPAHPPRPAVATVHDAIPLGPHGRLGACRGLAFALLARRAVRVVDAVICPSRSARADVCRRLGADPARVHVVPYGVGGRFAPVPPEAIARVRAAYRLPIRYALHLGADRPHKNLGRLVEAFAGLARDHPEAALALAGPRSPRFRDAGAATRAATLGDRVVALGDVAEADLPALYAGATCFVFPSFGEGFGLPVLEAMACGTAVVCSTDGALPEVTAGAALGVAPDDVGGLTAAIAAVFGDESLRASLSAAGRRRARELTWRGTAEATLAVYRSVVVRGAEVGPVARGTSPAGPGPDG